MLNANYKFCTIPRLKLHGKRCRGSFFFLTKYDLKNLILAFKHANIKFWQESTKSQVKKYYYQ